MVRVPRGESAVYPTFFFFSLLLIIFSSEITGEIQTEYKGVDVAIEGNPFVIVCRVSQFTSVKWQKDNNNLNNGSTYIWHDVIRDGAIISSLSVSHAYTFHSGSYRCDTLSRKSHHLHVLSATTVTAGYDYDGYKFILPKRKMVLECTIADGQIGDNQQIKMIWTKDKEIKHDEDGFSLNNKKGVFTLSKDKPSDKDTGNYTCEAMDGDNKLGSAVIMVASLPTAHLDPDTVVVEDEKLTLDCSVTGIPIPNVTWSIGDNVTLTTSLGRYKLLESNNVPNAKLQIAPTMMSDRGEYKCTVSNIVNTVGNQTVVVAVTNVRVKDKLAALWPFLGICAEVFVLCTIILIYEKKRNKAELDESDTDNSPEQKNTPDHGKDSVRQRK